MKSTRKRHGNDDPSNATQTQKKMRGRMKKEVIHPHETYSKRHTRSRIKIEDTLTKNDNISSQDVAGLVLLPDQIKSEELVIPDIVPSIYINSSSDNINTNVKIPIQEIKNEKQDKQKSKVKPLPKSPKNIRPTPFECEYATLSLSKLHPEVIAKNDTRRQTLLESCGMRDNITDAIISTMLSQNTTDANTKAAFKKLKETFSSWDDVAVCQDVSLIENCIRVAGLAKTRAERIQTMLRIAKKERGEASLDYVKDITDDEEVKKELSRFKGLGPKTISCVLLFALGRPEFPVDTHVLRITKQMGWISEKDTRESAYSYLNKLVPNHLKLDLHCLLVQHGKCCHRCASRNKPQFPPQDGRKLKCPLIQIPVWGGNIPKAETIIVCKSEV